MSTKCTTDCSLLVSSPEQEAQEQQLANQAKALAHPVRIRILRLLCHLDSIGGCLNSDLVGELGLAQSTVSVHLKVLREAGFITAEPNPPRVCYRVNRQQISEFQQLAGVVLD